MMIFWPMAEIVKSHDFQTIGPIKLSISELSEKSIHIKYLARSELTNFPFVVHREEQIKSRDNSKLIMPMTLPIWK